MKIVIEIDDSIIPDLEQFHGVSVSDITKTIQRIVLREIRKGRTDPNEPN